MEPFRRGDEAPAQGQNQDSAWASSGRTMDKAASPCAPEEEGAVRDPHGGRSGGR